MIKRTVSELKRIVDLPVVIANDAGKIIYVNAIFEAIFEWPRAEIIGRPLSTIIPPDLRDAHNLGFSRFALTKKSTVLDHPIKLQAVTRHGRIFAAEHFIVAERTNDDWTFAATIRPL